jgi:hypothetical protein
MVQRYAHLSPDHIKAAEKLAHSSPESASATGTNTGTASGGMLNAGGASA